MANEELKGNRLVIPRQIKEEFSIRDLVNEKNHLISEQGRIQNRINKIDSLIAKAVELGFDMNTLNAPIGENLWV